MMVDKYGVDIGDETVNWPVVVVIIFIVGVIFW